MLDLMNPNMPVGNQRELTDEALNKKFSFSFTRKQLLVLLNVTAPIQLPAGEPGTLVVAEVLDEIKRTAFTLTEKDYKNPPQAIINPANHVQTN